MARMVTVAGGTLTVTGEPPMVATDVSWVGPEYETFESREPDPAWSFTDPAGHEHRWMVPAPESGHVGEDPTLPTADRSMRWVECDGACGDPDHEGYEVPEWHCVRCGAEIEPRYRPCTRQMKVVEGYYGVTAEWCPEPDARGIVTLTEATGRVSGVEASLSWPAGPGQMLNLTGRVHGGGVESVGGRLDPRASSMQRTFRFEPS